jgi:CheY-like chemotaxis protein
LSSYDLNRRALQSVSDRKSAILIVEDEPLVRHIVREYLEEHGCSVLTAANGAEAAVILDSGVPITGLIADIRLGHGMTGWDVARYGRDRFPELPVLYITADSAYRASTEAVDHAGLLTKPFTSDHLIAAVDGWAN